MTLQPGSRVKGKYDGIPFAGTLREYNHISTIVLDRAIMVDSRFKDTLYMYETESIYKALIKANYDALCDHYLVEIFGTGKHLDKYLKYESLVSGRDRRAELVALGLIK